MRYKITAVLYSIILATGFLTAWGIHSMRAHAANTRFTGTTTGTIQTQPSSSGYVYTYTPSTWAVTAAADAQIVAMTVTETNGDVWQCDSPDVVTTATSWTTPITCNSSSTFSAASTATLTIAQLLPRTATDAAETKRTTFTIQVPANETPVPPPATGLATYPDACIMKTDNTQGSITGSPQPYVTTVSTTFYTWYDIPNPCPLFGDVTSLTMNGQPVTFTTSSEGPYYHTLGYATLPACTGQFTDNKTVTYKSLTFQYTWTSQECLVYGLNTYWHQFNNNTFPTQPVIVPPAPPTGGASGAWYMQKYIKDVSVTDTLGAYCDGTSALYGYFCRMLTSVVSYIINIVLLPVNALKKCLMNTAPLGYVIQPILAFYDGYLGPPTENIVLFSAAILPSGSKQIVQADGRRTSVWEWSNVTAEVQKSAVQRWCTDWSVPVDIGHGIAYQTGDNCKAIEKYLNYFVLLLLATGAALWVGKKLKD